MFKYDLNSHFGKTSTELESGLCHQLFDLGQLNDLSYLFFLIFGNEGVGLNDHWSIFQVQQ